MSVPLSLVEKHVTLLTLLAAKAILPQTTNHPTLRSAWHNAGHKVCPVHTAW
jgi:hypothetical protein